MITERDSQLEVTIDQFEKKIVEYDIAATRLLSETVLSGRSMGDIEICFEIMSTVRMSTVNSMSLLQKIKGEMK